MAQDNARRSFLKRGAIASAVLAGSIGAVASSAPAGHRGDSTGGGVVTGTSRKKETLYQKTAHWNEFYKSAK
jgi:hypothetical protein